MRVQIAVDGPSGVGKSTIARALAQRLGIVYVDTGAMYRAVGVKARRLGIDYKDEAALRTMLEGTRLSFAYRDGAQRALLDGEDVEDEIRTPEASRGASDVSTVPAVRQCLVAQQQELAGDLSLVMDGRDIGTHVLPGARYKFFLTAEPEIRARRRRDELAAKGRELSLEEVLREIVARDEQDTTRAASPLYPAEDAVIVDTSALDIAGVLALILAKMEEKDGHVAV